MNDENMACTFDGMSTRYVVQVSHGDTRMILQAFESIDDARQYIKLKYRGATRTVPMPRELAIMHVVEKYRYKFQRTKWDPYETLYILVSKHAV